jgi:hypothetical protein
MKKIYQTPATKVKETLLLNAMMLVLSPNTDADPYSDVETKERVDEEKGFGSYEW